MATRLKNIKYTHCFKLFLLVVGLSGVILGYWGALNYSDFSYALKNDYKLAFEEDIDGIHSKILLLNKYKSEEHIKSGAMINENELLEKVQNIKFEKNTKINTVIKKYDGLVAGQTNSAEAKRLMLERDETVTDTKKVYDKKLEQAKEELIAGVLARYNAAKQFLDNYDGLYYTILENGLVTGPEPNYYNTLPFYKKLDRDGSVVYIGFSQEAFKQASQYEVRHQNGLNGIKHMGMGLSLVVLSFAGLMFVAGRVPGSTKLHYNSFDRIYLDVGFLITGFVTMLCVFFAISMASDQKTQSLQLINYVALILLTVAYLTLAAYATMFAKRIKSREVIRHTQLYKFYRSTKTIAEQAYTSAMDIPADQKLLAKRTAILLAFYTVPVMLNLWIYTILAEAFNSFFALLVALGLFSLLVGGIVRLVLKQAMILMTLVEGIKKIKDGDLNHKIVSSGFEFVDTIADDINHIADGVKAAVDREMKAEHLKVELITNVSHDLKTPLTSIITYSDLLCSKYDEPEKVKEYADILKRKSGHLKQLVEDLFEVSKAQSRSIAVKLEELSLNDLIEQSFAEYEDDFKNAGLEVVATIPSEKIMILADGAKMWRVLSNVFENALKYTLPNTHVYVEVEVLNNQAILTVKNISNYMMQFKAEEVLERFKRGDAARSGEGSGLGLAIVKSFMEVQNGSCRIVVDGDLFKIMLTIPLN
ncbi:MAG: signal transduction histidine kinase [Firmicutes bacterium]|nr:signal transduction histidine kinase [Bacillota bacterium]